MPNKLLLADDSITIQRVIELTFADEDIDVIAVGDGKQALERVLADRPDIVLADVGMPERDGYDVAAFIKGSPQLAHIPVVLLTGAFEPLDEGRARSAGCDAVLVKPFEPQMVINRVKELLAGQRSPAAWGVPAARVQAPPADDVYRAPFTPPPVPVQPAPLSAPRPASAPASAPAPPPPPAPPPAPEPAFKPEPAPTPPPAPAPLEKVPGDPLEAYFDRLDAAFSNIPGAASAPRPPEPEQPSPDLPAPAAGALDHPSLAHPALGHPAPEPALTGEESLTPWDAEGAEDFEAARQPALANAFTALLAAEQGYAFGHAPARVAEPPVISEELIERIVQRVLARMTDDSVRRMILDTAERLVREEIERIKRSAG